MQTLVKSEELKEITSSFPFSKQLATLLMSIFKLKHINQLYSNCYSADTLSFIETVFKELNITIDCNEDELKNIPEKGKFITIANHPYGGIDGLILLYLILKKRPDFRVMANFLLKRIEPLSDKIMAVNPFEEVNVGSYTGIKESLKHLQNEGALGVFPAGEVSSYNKHTKTVTDKEWNPKVIKFLKKTQSPIIPIYFNGGNSWLFQALGMINPKLRSAKLPSELLNKKNKTIKVIIGKPVSVKEQNQITDINLLGRYLRARTYGLSTALRIEKFYRVSALSFPAEEQPIAESCEKSILVNEVKTLEQFLLFKSNDYEAYCAPAFHIPNLLNEIGRLREITFRVIGEGTNKSRDIDEYDLYYNHLFLWDTKNQQLVGAYRIGEGNKILTIYGRKGLYLNSLFKLKSELKSTLKQSIELGRSFIAKDYQQKPLPLFLLWKGILFYLLKNKEYRYLIGPVSISNQYSNFSKQLIIEFIKSSYYNHDLAKFVVPRNKFKPMLKDIDLKTILLLTENDIAKLDSYVKSIDQRNLPVPILLKKYIKQNAKIIGFNLDPKFNNCLDGLMILDLADVPPKMIKSLTEEFGG